MKDHFYDLLEYNFHFNQLLIENFLENNWAWTEKGRSLLNHILNAHQIWNRRILGQKTVEVWQINSDDVLLEINSKNYKDTLEILDRKDLAEIVSYKNSSGQEFGNTIQQVIFHFLNLSTYHRGQIAMLMKEGGLNPINTDYIFYKRDL